MGSNNNNGKNGKKDALRRLAKTIGKRAENGNPRKSYTASLLAAGPEKCAKKFGEEAVEAALACVNGKRSELIAECADTLYHMVAMLAVREVKLDEVYEELNRRMGVSGLEERKRRGGA